jgi:hypothetical protein
MPEGRPQGHGGSLQNKSQNDKAQAGINPKSVCPADELSIYRPRIFMALRQRKRSAAEPAIRHPRQERSSFSLSC